MADSHAPRTARAALLGLTLAAALGATSGSTGAADASSSWSVEPDAKRDSETAWFGKQMDLLTDYLFAMHEPRDAEQSDEAKGGEPLGDPEEPAQAEGDWPIVTGHVAGFEIECPDEGFREGDDIEFMLRGKAEVANVGEGDYRLGMVVAAVNLETGDIDGGGGDFGLLPGRNQFGAGSTILRAAPGRWRLGARLVVLDVARNETLLLDLEPGDNFRDFIITVAPATDSDEQE